MCPVDSTQSSKSVILWKQPIAKRTGTCTYMHFILISHINILVGHACSFCNYQHNPILLCFCFSCRENLKILLKDVNEQKKCIKENGIIVDGTHHGVQFVGKVINCLICYSTCINDCMHGTIKRLTVKSIRHHISFGTLGETMQLPYILTH